MGTGIESERGRASAPTSGRSSGEGLASALGWFSIGLGLAQLAAPRGVARLIGVRDDDQTSTLMRAVGLREIASGVGILSKPRPAQWVWTRVAGDVMDLALLGTALSGDSTRRGKTAAATAAVLGITALDVLCSERLSGTTGATMDEKAKEKAIHVTKSITVDRPPDEVYRVWRSLEDLPRLVRALESVEVIDDSRSRWRAKGPSGKPLTWDAEITEERPNELIAWQSLDGADLPNSGQVRFRAAPGRRGTEITVDMYYEPPGGAVTATVAKLVHKEPGQQVQEALRSFKQVLETGEVVVSDASRHGRPHPAHPPEQPVLT